MGFLMEEKRGLQLSHTVSSLSPTTCPGPLGFSFPIGPEEEQDPGWRPSCLPLFVESQ